MDPKETEKLQKRETWRTQLDFFLSLVGGSVGLGNVWRFPYLCYKNGGGAFFIPYFLSVVLLGFPILFLEVSLGQFMSEGLIGAYGRLVPLLQGVGIAMVMVEIYFRSYYNVIMAWTLRFLFASFTRELPWARCGNAWNTDQCVGYHHQTPEDARMLNGSSIYQVSTSNVIRPTDPATEYWQNEILQISSGVHDMGALRWDLVLCLLLAWVLVYVCICKGIKSSSMVMYVTATSPFLLLVILMVRGVTLPGAWQGIKFYIVPDWPKLTNPQVWTDAGTQVLFSYSIGRSVLCSLGSYNKWDHNSYRDAISFCCVNAFASILAGFVIFPILGYMAFQHNLDIADVASSGPGLAFIAYPNAVATLPVAPVWSILFFLCLLMLGLDSEFVGVETFCTCIVDTWPHILRKGYRKEVFIGVTCSGFFLLGLPMVTQGGMYVFLMFDYYVGSIVLILLVVGELVAVAYIYGAKRFKENIEMMLGYQISQFIVICWTVLAPITILGMLVLVLSSMNRLTYNNTYEYPTWSVLIGSCMPASCVIIIPLTAFVKLASTPGTFAERLVEVTRPMLKSHQLRPYDDPKDLMPVEPKSKDIKVIDEHFPLKWFK